jgi:hypothetical protein
MKGRRQIAGASQSVFAIAGVVAISKNFIAETL